MSDGYAELHCLSNFAFLRGASHPEELVRRAAALGYRALAITDECSLAGVVRAHVAAREHALRLIVGSELTLRDGIRLVLLVPELAAWRQLSRLITRGRRAAAKGGYRLERADLEGNVDACLALWLPGARPDPEQAVWLRRCLPGRSWIAVELTRAVDDGDRLQRLREIGARLGLPLVAAGDVHMHEARRRPLQDTLTAIRLGCEVSRAGTALHPNGERHLRPREALTALYPAELLAESVRVAGRCRFSLDQLDYRYPAELVPAGETPASHLRRLVRDGMARRWPGETPESVRVQVEHELVLIAELGYEPYFLTVHDLVDFARGRGILCQGRGSAANSAVCYCLGITEVDPARGNLLFERFVSRERGEPPDIDVDFEHERREEVIQYVYRKYGRRRAALAATVICYRPRSAVRDVGRALGLSQAQIDALAGSLQWWDGSRVVPGRMREAGLEPDSPVLRRLAWLVNELIGFPRHLSQHVGGFVISEEPVDELVPVENAAMPGRTVIQWDKDDLDALGLLKVDVLALGMLTAIRRSFDLIEAYRGRRWSMAGIPAGDPEVYTMISRADTTGVFQIESRAQMAMLPRLRPRCFYDLVIEVAIVRPGPIQGDMVHPYLARRCGEQPVSYPSPEVRRVLERTLGVPIFQEQVMQLAIVAGGFSPGEADRLRRAMAAWRRRGGLEPFEERLVEGMRGNGYEEAFARRVFAQIRGFGEYGFPESHAASFALLVYVSAWLKYHEPAAFCAALLNSQPMGFYAPAQLVQDVRRHGVAVRPVDVLYSDHDCALEPGRDGEPALRLGLRMVRGLSAEAAQRLVAARDEGSFAGTGDLAARARLGRRELECLAAAGALKALAGNRHRARWQVAGVEPTLPLFRHAGSDEGAPSLPEPGEGEELVADYASLGLSLGRHPVGLLRSRLAGTGVVTAADLAGRRDGAAVRVGGLVINRQRPGSAGGVTFMTLEDETGAVNVIVWPDLAERQRRELLQARLLVVRGTLQNQHGVRHVIAGRLEDRSRLLGELTVRSRDFR
ncbi:MAG TPA: error-prone DNA polymerase [Gammaproteobacteria bacterium]|nr:error-prone DNA polymerase [Gammaproteobacteria bacterium]